MLVNYGMTNHSNFGDINPLTVDHRVCQKGHVFMLQAKTHKNGGFFSCHKFDLNLMKGSFILERDWYIIQKYCPQTRF